MAIRTSSGWRRWTASTLAAGALAAQQPLDLPPVATDVVHVDVVATDARGRPVRDLARDDFTLFVDGAATPFELFEPPSPGRGTAARAASPAPKGASPHPAPTAPDVRAPWLVVHLDAEELTPGGRRRVFDGLEDWLLAQVAAGERLLVTVSDRGVRVLGPPAADLAAARELLARAAALPVRGARRTASDQAIREAVRDLVVGAEETGQTCGDVFRLAQSLVESRARERSAELRAGIETLAGLVAALSTLPGNKSLLLLGEGLEQRPAIALFHQLGDICPAAVESDPSRFAGPMQLYDLSRDWQALAARANAARVTFYPVDAAGLRSASAADVAHELRRFAPSSRNDRVRDANERAAPGILADETGGLAIHSRNRPATALSSVVGDHGARYALGFTPRGVADGQRHSVRVEARRSGIRLRHRQSFRHAEPGDALLRQAWSTLLLGVERDDLGVTGDARFDAGGRLEVALLASGSSPVLGRVRVVMLHRGERGIEAREKEIEPFTSGVVVGFEAALPFDEVAVALQEPTTGRTTLRRLVAPLRP